jgi:antitoxin (DNA-binding transcriptional repressor) of toxin-antitoxin stability system
MAHIRRVAIAQARATLKDLVEDVRNGPERIKLTRYDRTLAGLVPASDLHLLEECKRALEERERGAPRRAVKQGPPRRRSARRRP